MKKGHRLPDAVMLLCLLFLAGALTRDILRLPKPWVRTAGTVIRTEEHIEEHTDYRFRSTVCEYEYKAAGATHHGEATYRGDRTPLVVFYDPASPSRSRLYKPPYVRTPMSYLFELFFLPYLYWPWSRLVIATVFVGFFAAPYFSGSERPGRRWPLLMAAASWLALAAYEAPIRSINAPIRIDLALIVPAMVLVSVGCPLAVFVAEQFAKQRMRAGES